MVHRCLFFLDRDGRLVGPESAPSSDEARTVDAALAALREEAGEIDPAVFPLIFRPGRERTSAPRRGG